MKQAFGKPLRLLNSSDFQSVFADAPFRASHQYFLVLARANQLARPRLGLVIAKKHIRLSVQRNRIKRLIRESFRKQQQSLAGIDVIVLARKGMDELPNAAIAKQLDQQWERVLRKARQASEQNKSTSASENPCVGLP